MQPIIIIITFLHKAFWIMWSTFRNVSLPDGISTKLLPQIMIYEPLLSMSWLKLEYNYSQHSWIA